MQTPKYFRCVHHSSNIRTVRSEWDTLYEIGRVYQATEDEREFDGTVRLLHPEQSKDVREIIQYWVNSDCFEEVSEEDYIKSVQESEGFLTKLRNKLNNLLTKMKNLFAIVALLGVMILAQSCGGTTNQSQETVPAADTTEVVEAPAAETAPTLDSVAADSAQ